MTTSRIPMMPQAPREGFGLFAFIESKRVVLPLKGVECDFSVVSGIGEVSMTQIFRQDNEKPLDCQYLFPLPADASVYFCEADINGRKIRAQVRERWEAQQMAAQKKAEGFRTALVEAERENLFTLSLGNVQPGDLVIIQLKYFQTLRSLAGMPSIELPFCPGIRYIPGVPLLIRSNKGKGIVDDTDQVPDASRITPVRIDSEHPDAAYIEVRGTLDGKFVNEKDLSSPSHSIEVHRVGEQLRVSLSDKGDVPDRDFVLRWSEQSVGAVASRAWFCERGEKIYALLEIRAPKDAPCERAPVDFYFLVDRSGSMAGEKWNKAAEALQSCMKVLGPTDRAMVTFFESRFQDFSEQPLRVQDILSDPQFEAVKKIGADGGTELGPALSHILEVSAMHSGSNPKNLILITDAQVGNESGVLRLMERAQNFPVHCFGIDIALNDSLLLALSRQQGGTFHSLNPNDDIQQAVTTLGKTLGQPVLTGLRLSAGWETADLMIPNLYAGQIHHLSACASGSPPLEVSGQDAASQSITVQFERQGSSFDAPYLHWCRSRIRRLVAEGQNSSAVALSVESNLICPLTAFIAWDESEKVSVANYELCQPNQMVGLMETTWCGFAGLGKDESAEITRGGSGFAGRGKMDHRLRSSAPRKSRSLGALARWLRSGDADELSLKRELTDICHITGVSDWPLLVTAIFDWISAATGNERAQRLEALKQLLQDLKVQAVRYLKSSVRAGQNETIEARAKIYESLKQFVEKLQAKDTSPAK